MNALTLRPPPLRRTLALTVALLIAVAFALVTVLKVLLYELPRAEQEQLRAARQLLDTIQQTIGMSLVTGDTNRAENVLSLYGTFPDLEVVAAMDDRGIVLMSTRFAYRGHPGAAVIADLDTALVSRVQQLRRPLLKINARHDAINAYAPLTLAARPGELRPAEVGTLYLRYDLRRARANAWRAVLAPGYWASVLVAVLVSGLLLAVLLNRWVSRPLRHLGERVSRLAAGESGVTSGLLGRGEIALLGHGFDRMSAQISRGRTALERANRDLEGQIAERTRHLEDEIRVRRAAEHALQAGQRELHSVLEALAEGVALWDAAGRLRYANPAVRRLWPGSTLHDGHSTLGEFLQRLQDKDAQPLALRGGSPAGCLAERALRDGVVVRAADAGAPLRWYNLACAPLDGADGETPAGLVLSLTDVTEIQTHSDSLARLANHDRLTGLPNRNLLHDRMNVALAHDIRSGRGLAVCYLDLDGFKAVNDRLGHEAGDDLLREVARRLSAQMRGDDTVARLGGDEFVLLLSDLAYRWDCEPVLQRVLSSLSEPYRIQGQDVVGVSASIGVTLFPSDDSDPDTLLRHADQAMYAAKRAGKNQFRWFSQDHHRRSEASEQTVGEIRDALTAGELVLHYQPVVDCRAGRVIGAEALLRWQHPVLGLLPAAQFLPLIENRDLAEAVGDFVVEKALTQVCAWRRSGYPLMVSVNVFARQLRQAEFFAGLAARIADAGHDGCSALQLEIVESAALNANIDIARLVAACRELGVVVALDGFGTGQASLDQLLRIPADVLKIDRGFVRDVLDDPEDRSLVQAIIGLGVAFGRTIVAQGVERREQVAWLLRTGCGVMQGQYFALPMPAAEFITWVDAYRADPEFLQPDEDAEYDAEQASTGI